MGPDDYPSLEAEPLTPKELLVRDHWRRFLPSLTKQLEDQGPNQLDLAVRKAVWLAEYHTMLAMAQKPKLPRALAEELFREEVWMPAEPKARRDRARYSAPLMHPHGERAR